MKRELSWWILERHNPQLDKPYYIACGQISKTAAKRKENTLYGMNVMRQYKDEKAYRDEIDCLKSKGFSVG